MLNQPETTPWSLGLSPTVTSVLIWTLAAAALGIVAFWILARLRDRTDDRYDTTGLLANLEELRSRGEITEAEYRTIQTARDQRRRSRDPDRPAASPDQPGQAGPPNDDDAPLAP